MGRSIQYRSEPGQQPDHEPRGRTLKHGIGDLNADAVARLVSASADIALIVNSDGIIEDLTIGNEELPRHEVTQWIGQPWIDRLGIVLCPAHQ